MKRCIIIILLFTLLFSISGSVNASSKEAEMTRASVWALRTFEGKEYIGVFSPAASPDLYIMAGTANSFTLKETYVYYWDLDREYKADWTRLNRQLPGTLEIRNLSGVRVASLGLVKTLFDMSNPQTGQQDLLYTEAKAESEYNQYLRQKEEYFAAVNEYDLKLENYYKALERGEKPAPVEHPEVFSRLLSEPTLSFIVNLPAGDYRIHVNDENGKPVQGSERNLHSIEPRQKGIGYEIIPYSKWTNAEKSDTGENIVYSSAEKIFYVKPSLTYEYNELELARLKNPQEKASSRRNWVWVYDLPITDRTLRLQNPMGLSEIIKFKDYKVVQTGGSALGYTIEPFTPAANSSSPDIQAFEIHLKSDFKNLTFELVDQQGTMIPNSQRKIIFVPENLPWYLIAIALIPLIVSEYIHFRKNTLKRKIKKLLIQ